MVIKEFKTDEKGERERERKRERERERKRERERDLKKILINWLATDIV